MSSGSGVMVTGISSVTTTDSDVTGSLRWPGATTTTVVSTMGETPLVSAVEGAAGPFPLALTGMSPVGSMVLTPVVSSVRTTPLVTTMVSTVGATPLASTVVPSSVGGSSSMVAAGGTSPAITGPPSIGTGSSGGLSPAAAVFLPTSSRITSDVTVAPSSVIGTSAGSVDVLPGIHEPTLPTGGVMDKFSQLLKAQTEVMTAQVKAAAVQSLPSLTHYTGEGSDATDDEFDRWVERFRERAKFADWTEAEQLYQLKLHLDKLALDVFRMLPDDERKTMDSTLAALRKRFRPADIEELRGLDFHHRMQDDGETIEQLEISIQQLGRKAFPTITGKDFDRLLKGRFYQALLVKWQRKLGCPKPDEGFHELLARARMLEGHEKQFAVSALNRSGTKSGSNERSRKQHAKSSERQAASTTSRTTEKSAEVGIPSQFQCYKCKQVGHVRRDCPVRRDTGRNSTTGAADKREAPGRTTQVNTNVVEATSLPARLEDLTETQLEQLLATKRLG